MPLDEKEQEAYNQMILADCAYPLEHSQYLLELERLGGPVICPHCGLCSLCH